MLCLPFLATGCALDPNEQFIQGRWEFVNTTGDDRSGPLHFYWSWVFDRGTFFEERLLGVSAINEYMQGRYRIVSSEGDRMVIEIYDLHGTLEYEENAQLWIEIDREADRIRIRQATFERGFP